MTVVGLVGFLAPFLGCDAVAPTMIAGIVFLPKHLLAKVADEEEEPDENGENGARPVEPSAS